MAIVTSTFSGNAALFTAFTNAPDLFDTDNAPWGNALDEFFDESLTTVVTGGNGVTTETGNVYSGIYPPGTLEGSFTITGTNLAAGAITQIVYEDANPAGTLTIKGSINGVAGTGTITEIIYDSNTYDFHFKGSGSLTS